MAKGKFVLEMIQIITPRSDPMSSIIADLGNSTCFTSIDLSQRNVFTLRFRIPQGKSTHVAYYITQAPRKAEIELTSCVTTCIYIAPSEQS